MLNCGTDGCAYADISSANLVLSCTSTTGDSCDSAIAGTGFAQDGICTTTGCATSQPVSYYNLLYYAGCTANYSCENNVLRGDFNQNGTCTGATCCVSGVAIDDNRDGFADTCATACGPPAIYVGDPCDDTLTNGAFSAAKRCVGGTCCAADGVDNNQAGTYGSCGCTGINNGSICDHGMDLTFEGVCVGTTCVQSGPVSLNCGTDGCSNADKGATASASCGSTTGYACQSALGSYTNYFFTSNGICTNSGCTTTVPVSTNSGTYYSGCTANYACDNTISANSGDFNQDGVCYGGTTSCCTGSNVVIDHISRDGTADTCVAACTATYRGDPCDTTLTGGAYSKTGVCCDLTGSFTCAGGASANCCTNADCGSNYCVNYVCTDLSSNKKLIFQDSSGTSKAFFDDAGDMVLSGSLTQSGTCASTAPTGNAFKLQNASGYVKAWIDSTGAMCIKGSLTQSNSNWASCASNSFIVANSAGAYQSCIDDYGNLYLGRQYCT
jgi:hypothetical protein